MYIVSKVYLKNIDFDRFKTYINKIDPYLYNRDLIEIYTYLNNAKTCPDRLLKKCFIKSILDYRECYRKVGDNFAEYYIESDN